MSTHTPGPWSARIDPHGKPHYWIKTPGGFVIARVSGHGESDAALIAAAPEMLEALRNLLVYDTGDMPGDYIEAARGVIAKAEGRA